MQSKADIEAKDKANAAVQDKNASLNLSLEKLQAQLNKQQIKKAVIENPTAAETTVNQDLKKFNDCVFVMTGGLPDPTSKLDCQP